MVLLFCLILGMKCQILFTGENKKNISICLLLKFYPEYYAFRFSNIYIDTHTSKKQYSKLVLKAGQFYNIYHKFPHEMEYFLPGSSDAEFL